MPGERRLTFRLAGPEDAGRIAHIRAAAARALTERYGTGHWSAEPDERGARQAFRDARIWLALEGDEPVATFRLATRKPWAIDRACFAPARRPLYLTDMAVRPERQRRGIGRACLAEVARQARAWPADAVWLDAYDADAGAGPFYARCGYREAGRRTYRGNPLVYFELRLEPGATPASG